MSHTRPLFLTNLNNGNFCLEIFVFLIPCLNRSPQIIVSNSKQSFSTTFGLRFADDNDSPELTTMIPKLKLWSFRRPDNLKISRIFSNRQSNGSSYFPHCHSETVKLGSFTFDHIWDRNNFRVFMKIYYTGRQVIKDPNYNQLSEAYVGQTIMIIWLLSILSSFKRIFMLNICTEFIEERYTIFIILKTTI